MDLIRTAVSKHPNRRNPKDDGLCRYTSKGGHAHCIAGQVMKDVGIKPPAFDVVCGFDALVEDDGDGPEDWDSAPVREKFSSEAVELIARAQGIFDEGTYDGDTEDRRPQLWADALSALETCEYERAVGDPF